MKFGSSLFRSLASGLTALISICLLAPSGLGSSVPAVQQSDEDLVRKGYFNLQYYHSAGKRAEAAKERREHIPYDDIDIQIFNTYTGFVREFVDRRFFDLVTPPTDEMIQLTSFVRTTDKDPTQYLVYEAKWVRGRYVPPSPVTFRKWLQAAGSGYSDVEKVTTYEVRVRLDGKEKIYRAMALHHKPPQMKKDGKIEYLDLIIGNSGALTNLTVEDRPAFGARERKPAGKSGDSPGKPTPKDEADPRRGGRQPGRQSFKLSRLDAEPASGLLYEQGSCDMSGLCCPSGSTSMTQCCSDPMGKWSSFLPSCSTGGSGTFGDFGGWGDFGGGYYDGGGDPYPSGGSCIKDPYYANPSEHSDSNSNGHIFGSHGGSTSMQSYCNVESDCRASCDVNFLNIQQYEYGMLTLDLIPPLGALVWHSVGSPEKYIQSGSGYVNGSNTPPSCGAGIAFTVKKCILGSYCTHSVKFNGSIFDLTVSSDDNPYLLYKHTTTHTCPRLP